MPPGLTCLYDVEGDSDELQTQVDLVAVHGIAEDTETAWTNKANGVNWLRDLLPEELPTARVLVYGYDASVSGFFGVDAALELQRNAETFLQELHTYRRQNRIKERPIIFICHGLGGLLVKRALMESSTKTMSREHLLDASVSTYAIMFFGTPHGSTSVENWRALEKRWRARNKLNVPNFSGKPEDEYPGIKLSEVVTSDFRSHASKYSIFCSWEQEPTFLGHEATKLVESNSAILTIDGIDTLGIHADHAGMVKFGTSESQGYKVVIANLLRYIEQAPATIAKNWRHLREEANTTQRASISQDFGLSQASMSPGDHFYPPKCTSDHLFGRQDELQVIYNSLFPHGRSNTGQGLKSVVIYGMGGSGKTELCARFAEAYRDRYSAIFTINAGSPSAINSSLAEIAGHGGYERTMRAGMHFLSRIKYKWLLIIDNADDDTIDLPALFPHGNVAHILITTRSEDAKEHGKLGVLKIGGLPETDALHLLLEKANVKQPWTAAIVSAGQAIAKVLGYLAIALKQAGSYIATNNKDRESKGLVEYLKAFATARTRIQSRVRLDEKSDPGLQKTYATFELSRRNFENHDRIARQDAVELLNVAAFFHFQRIPLAIFIRAIEHRKQSRQEQNLGLLQKLQRNLKTMLEPQADLPAIALRPVVDENDVRHAVTVLRTSSLVNYDGKEDCFSLHPLVHSWARDSISESERKMWSLRAFNILMEAVNLTPKLSDDDRKFHDNIIPHLEAVLSDPESTYLLVRQKMGFIQAQFAMLMPKLHLWRLGNQVLNGAKCGFVLADRGYFEKAVVHLRAVTNTLFHSLGIHHDSTMLAALLLANVCWGLGRLDEAIGLQHSVVTAREHVYGASHELTLQAMDSLGYSYWLHGYHFEALDLHLQATKLMKETLGSEHESTLTALDHLGTSLGSLYRFEERLEIHEQVLACRKKSLPPMHPDTLVTMDHIGVTLLELGRPYEAKPIITTVHKERQRQLGKEHPWTLWSLSNLAKIHIALDDCRGAEAMLTWGIAAAERSLSKGHLGVLMGRGELGRALARQGKLDEAETLTLETIRRLEPSRGRTHPDCVFGFYKLGQLYELKKEPEKAVSVYKEALQRVDERITDKHPLAEDIRSALRKSENCNEGDGKLAPNSHPTRSHERKPSIKASSTW